MDGWILITIQTRKLIWISCKMCLGSLNLEWKWNAVFLYFTLAAEQVGGMMTQKPGAASLWSKQPPLNQEWSSIQIAFWLVLLYNEDDILGFLSYVVVGLTECMYFIFKMMGIAASTYYVHIFAAIMILLLKLSLAISLLNPVSTMLKLGWVFFSFFFVKYDTWKQDSGTHNHETGGPLIISHRKQATWFQKQNKKLEHTNQREGLISESIIKTENTLDPNLPLAYLCSQHDSDNLQSECTHS